MTVLRGGWWLPGRVLTQGEALELDAATAEALARRGIVRLSAAPAPEEQTVASNAGKTARKRQKED